MKKLLFVFPTLEPGGAERNAIGIANHLVARYGYEITFFVYDHSHDLRGEIDPRITVLQANGPLRSTVTGSWRFYLYYYFHLGYRLARTVEPAHFDHIIAIHESVPEAGCMALWFRDRMFLRTRKVRYLSIIQISLAGRDRTMTSWFSRRFSSLFASVRRNVFDHIVALSPAVARSLGQQHTRVTLIPNHVDPEGVVRRSHRPSSVSLGDRRFVVCLARISPQKNPMLLLRAFARIADEISIDLHFIGTIVDVGLHQEMMRFIRNHRLEHRVFVHGPTSTPEAVIVRSSAVVLSSDYEGIPLVLLESMVLKRPVILTAFDGHDELWNEKNSIIIPLHAEDALIEALKRIDRRDPSLDLLVEKASVDVCRMSIAHAGELYHRVFSEDQQ